jgi:hypothetical protein
MTSHMNSPYAYKFVFAIAVSAIIVVAGSVGAGNGERRIDASTLLSSPEIANLPVLTVQDPF